MDNTDKSNQRILKKRWNKIMKITNISTIETFFEVLINAKKKKELIP